MIVAAQMQHAVQHKLLYLKLERKPILVCLLRGLLGGNNDVTKKMLLVRFELVSFVREREYVSGRILSAEEFVQLGHSPV